MLRLQRSMTNHEVNKLVAKYIVGIGREGVPNSHLWLAIDTQMSDLDLHQKVLSFLKSGGVVKESGFFLTLTDKGLAVLKQIEDLYK